MPFEKGNKASNGRPKGAKSKKTLILEGFIHSILEGGAEKFHNEVMKLKGKDFINAYKDLLEYGMPKLARKEVTTNIETNYKPPNIIIDGNELTIKR